MGKQRYLPISELEAQRMLLSPERVAEIIRARRLALGWSQSELARRLNMDQATVSHWEKANGNTVAYRMMNFALGMHSEMDGAFPQNGDKAITEMYRRRALAAEDALMKLTATIREWREGVKASMRGRVA